ncbi:tetratricopeptide repeat protein [Mycolicibacterium fortuitum]
MAEALRQALDYVRQLGADHETTLAARANLGNQRGLAGDVTGALLDLEITTDRCLAVLGTDNTVTVATAGMRAYWLDRSGDRAAALAAYERLWPLAVSTLGPEHPTTVSIRHSYSDIRDWTDNPGGAVHAYEEILAANTRNLGPDHPNTTGAAATLGHWRTELNDLADMAHDIYADEQLHGSGNDELSEEQRNRVDDAVAELIGGFDSAIDGVVELHTILAALTRERGPDDPEVLDTRSALAGQKLAAGDIAGGLADYEILISDLTRVYGPTDRQTFRARRHHAFALDHTASGISARIAALEVLLADELSALGPEDPVTMQTRMYHAGSKKQAAELRAVLADQIRVLGAEHPDVALTRHYLASASD